MYLLTQLQYSWNTGVECRIYIYVVIQAVMVSDVFTQRAHFEWLFSTLMHVYKVHPTEDEFVAENVVYGVCKAAAIAGLVSELLTIEFWNVYRVTVEL